MIELSEVICLTNLFAEAVKNILARGDSTGTAQALYDEWSDQIADLEKPAIPTPADAPLLTAYPNPFNPTTAISYRVDAPGMVTVNVYNVAGQHVRQLTSGEHRSGLYTASWDGLDMTGRQVGTGAYLVRLVTPTQTFTQRVTLLR